MNTILQLDRTLIQRGGSRLKKRILVALFVVSFVLVGVVPADAGVRWLRIEVGGMA